MNYEYLILAAVVVVFVFAGRAYLKRRKGRVTGGNLPPRESPEQAEK